MSQVLLIVLGVYLAGCYAYGCYLVYRLLTTPTAIRPTSRLEPTQLARAARVELNLEHSDEQGEDKRLAA